MHPNHHHFIFKYWIIITLAYFIPAYAHATSSKNLSQIYALAVLQDPTLQAAQAALRANRQVFPQALAQMAPNLSASYNTTATQSNLFYLGSYNTTNYSFNLTQPIYHPEHWAQLEQARYIAKGAGAVYLSATQALMIRVANQYFAILGSLDDLHFTQAQRKAFKRQLEQTQQRFEVGLIAITDVQDAKARFDSAVADEIAAANAVADQYEKLREITGDPIENVTLFPTTHPLALLPPTPNNQETWVTTAHRENLDIIAAKETAQQLKAAVAFQAAGHYPKVDVTGSLGRSKNAPPFPFDLLGYSKSVALNISVPIFAGGGVIFRTQEAKARYEEALKKLEVQQRATDSETRQAFRGVLTALSGVQALHQAALSSKTALDATQAAYEAGTRTMVDLLNAQSDLFKAERDHAKARYQYLLEGLKLKQAAGVLSAQDLFAVNDLITGTTS